MADSGRLDELKRKFDENPRRYFAPLANEYRKAGDAERAIELCRTYLPQQPTHMSGYIVYGQALFDAGHVDEAAAVFQQALTLDPENIIALRYLGDITAAKGDRAAAVRWYAKVLELDPRNEEIAALLAELASPDQPRRYEGPERPAPPTVRPEPQAAGEVLALEELIRLPDVPQAEIIVPVEPAPSVTSIETADESVTIIRWPTDEEERAAGAPAEEPVHGASVASMMDFALDEPFGVAAFGAGTEASEPAEDETPVSFGGSPLGGESYGDEDFTGEPLAGAVYDAQPPGEGAADAEPAQAEPAQEVSSLADESDWGEDHSPSSGGPFVTETMAELYIAQGMRGEALAVYRQLVERHDEPRLRARIAELEGTELEGAEPEPAQPQPAEAGAAQQAAAAPQNGAAAGESVREFFARIGARRADAAPHISADGASELARLFGAASLDASDVGAARSLAGAFASVSPDDVARTA